MCSPRELLLAEFVGRTNELKRFCEILEVGEKRIMVVSGNAGLGKTSLLACMMQECVRRKLWNVEVVWDDLHYYDYLEIMCKIRDGLGLDYFKDFTYLVNYFTVPGFKLAEGSSVADEAEINNSTLGDIANVVIKDSTIFVFRLDLKISESERMSRLTDCFIQDLAVATAKEGKPLIVFFDGVERMTKYTHKWAWEELFMAVADKRLDNVRFVISGRKSPKLDRHIRRIVEEAKLQPFDLCDIIEYLKKLRVGKQYLEEHELSQRAYLLIAQTLRATTGGNPVKIAQAVEALDGLLNSWDEGRHRQ